MHIRLKLLAALVCGICGAGMASAGEIQGTVVVTGCPGPARLGKPCATERPVQVPVVAFAIRDNGSPSGRPVATASSDASGRFQLKLPPGRYQLVPRPSNPGQSAKPSEVTVGEGTITVTLRVDSGMR